MTTTHYKSRGLSLRLGCLLSLAAATPALAQTYTQTQTFPFNFSNSGSSPLTVVDRGDFMAMAQPFISTVGPLVSFEITWDITMTGSAIAGDPDGSIGSSGGGGNYLIAGISYSGNGSGDGDGGLLDEPLSLSFNVANSELFLASNAGVTYDPAILTSVLGGSPFPLLWDTGYGVTGSNVRSLSGTAVGSVTLTYTYLPEASTNVAMGLAFAAVGGMVWRRRKASKPEVAETATK